MNCTRCGRKLRSASSIKHGMGRTCRRRKAQEDLVANVPQWQVEKARQLIDDNAYQREGDELFTTVSSDGAQLYHTTPSACTCEAGQHGKLCYHSVATIMLLAA